MSRRPRLALATGADSPEGMDEDRELSRALAPLGIDAEPAIWSVDQDWRCFDGVLLRSTWDYHHHADAFLDWLESLETAGVRVANPPSLVRWNTHKRYLVDLEQRSIRTIPTVVVEQGSTTHLASILRERGWSRWVTKPAISASAFETHAWTEEELAAAEAAWSRNLAHRDMLVQPWIEAVRDGEWSLIHFHGRFSHAVWKQPSPDDFRVQWEHGGRHARAEPPAGLVEHGTAVLTSLGSPLYARFDAFVDGTDFLVSEIELIEPYLFLSDAPESYARFAAAIREHFGY